MNPSSPIDLDPLLDFTSAPFVIARLRWHLARHKSLQEGGLESGDLLPALHVLEKIADLLANQNVPPAAWELLMSALVWSAAATDAWPDTHRIFQRYSMRAWPTGEDRRRLPGLWRALAGLASPRAESGAISVAEELTTLFPDSPIGPYATAHFTELQHRRRGTWTPDQLRRVSASFKASEDLASKGNFHELSAHARLRQGVLALAMNAHRDEGRQLLHSLATAQLSPSDRLWCAFGLFHSPHWLDRVRSADVLDDLAIEAEGPGRTFPHLDLLRETAAQLLHMAPLKLEAAEEDRLRALTQTLFRPPFASRWENLVDVRLKLATCREDPLSKAAAAFPVLDTLARDSSPAADQGGWHDAFGHFAQLAAAWNEQGRKDSQSLELQTRTPDFQLGAMVSQILDALGDEDPLATERGLRELRDELRSRDALADPGPLRPLALLWPRLLKPAGTHEKTDEIIAELARLWILAAPEPSYGWWALAAHFFRASLPTTGCIAARRALSEGARGDGELKKYVLGKSMDHIVEEGQLEDLRRWLEDVRQVATPPRSV